MKLNSLTYSSIKYNKIVKNKVNRGAWVAQWVKPLPSAQVMVSGSWDRAPHQALCSAGSLLASLSLCLLLCLLVIYPSSNHN